MTVSFDDATRHRFLRTLRVATGVAIARYHQSEGQAAFVPVARFRALAAKGADAWRFPEAGVLSTDGLVLATLVRADDGVPVVLELQAQGSAGLTTFAGRSVMVTLAGMAPIGAAFDRLGRLRLDIAGFGFGEDDLATFDLHFTDDAS
jgi:hypothetical protein